MDEFFKSFGDKERTGSWSTNSVQGYLHHRNLVIANMQESLRYFESHLDVKAYESLVKAMAEMNLANQWEAYSNQSGEILQRCAERLKGINQGLAFTDVGTPLEDLAMEAAFGKSPLR